MLLSMVCFSYHTLHDIVVTIAGLTALSKWGDTRATFRHGEGLFRMLYQEYLHALAARRSKNTHMLETADKAFRVEGCYDFHGILWCNFDGTPLHRDFFSVCLGLTARILPALNHRP